MRIKPFINKALKIVVVITTVFLIVCAGAVVWLNSNSAQQWIQNSLIEEASNASGCNIKIKNLHFSFPLYLNADEIKISDTKGVWLSVVNAKVNLIPELTIPFKLKIRSVKADEIFLIREPIIYEQSDDSSGGLDFAIGKIDVRALKLSKVISELGDDISLTLHAKIDASLSKNKIESEVEVKVLEGLPKMLDGSIIAKTTYDLVSSEITFDKIGYISPDIKIHGDGIYNVDSQELNFKLESKQVKLSNFIDELEGDMRFSANISGDVSNLNANLQLQQKSIVYDKNKLSDVTYNIVINKVDELITGDIQSISSSQSKSLNAKFGVKNSTLSVDNIAIKTEEVELKGSAKASVDTISGPTKINLNFHIPSFLIGDVKGEKINLKISASEEMGNWNADVKSSGEINQPFEIEAKAKVIILNSDKPKLFVTDLNGNYEDHFFTGEVEADAESAKIQNATYKNKSLGLTYKKINSSVTFKDGQYDLSFFEACDKEGHKIRISGTGFYESKSDFKYDFNTSFEKFKFVNSSLISAVVSGDIALKGNNQSGLVKGHLKSDSIYFYIPDTFVSQPAQLNIVNDEALKKESFFGNYPLKLDLNWVAKNQVFIHGKGVDAELAGDLKVVGQANSPIIQGKLGLVRGKYSEFGKKFKIEKADLFFEGMSPPMPIIDIITSTDASTATIKPHISGFIDDIKITIESNPSMPQDEALSLLLFGEDPSQITAFQAAQLASSIAKLSGNAGGGLDPMDKARKILNVDDISINNDGDDPYDTTIGVGKYISDKVYLEVEQGASPQSSKTTIEAEVRPNVSVESSTSATGESEVGVYWKRDY